MTVIKQQGVTSKSHQKNLRDYINADEKVLLRESQNMEGCKDLKRWASYMAATRKAFGHDKASRKGKDGKEAKNTILYHQILAFNPDECDVNGGKLSPEDCMRYAKEYAGRHYPNQQIVFALHNERCEKDGTHRYAVHMVINRTNLVTGRRLAEGRGSDAKRTRARRVRRMDAEWGLRQVEEGRRNSRVHRRQEGQHEHAMQARDPQGSYKYNLREMCRIAAQRTGDVVSYREWLESHGISTELRRGRMYVTDKDNARYSFLISRLDGDLSPEGLESSFRANIVAEIREKGRAVAAERQTARAEAERIEGLKQGYLAEIKGAYLAYRRQAHSLEGVPIEDFPKMTLARPPREVARDPEVERTVLAYWRGADELRASLAARPYSRKQSAAKDDAARRAEGAAREGERGGEAREEPGLGKRR